MKILNLAVAAILFAGPALAQGADPVVENARAAGFAGEQADGYLGVRPGGPADLKARVDAINIQRRSLYSRLAAQKGATPQEVGLTAGCQLLGRVGVGQAYLLSDGSWRRRAAGEGSVVPAYCR